LRAARPGFRRSHRSCGVRSPTPTRPQATYHLQHPKLAAEGFTAFGFNVTMVRRKTCSADQSPAASPA
jgi:hypothetical protein